MVLAFLFVSRRVQSGPGGAHFAPKNRDLTIRNQDFMH